MSSDFSGKSAIITGASSGLGRAMALRLGRAGMTCWLVGRSAEQLQHTAGLIEEQGGESPQCVTMDLAEPGALAALVRRAASQHPWLFALVNNAAVMYPEPVTAADVARTREMFEINLFSMMEGCTAAVAAMRAHGRPAHLVNVSSLASRNDRYGAYSVVKAAVNQLGEVLRHELEQDDIRVTTIVPGGFTTDLARGFSPESLARAGEAFAELGFDPGAPGAARMMGDPDHVAAAVEYVLQQPIELNLSEIVIRPAVSIDIA